MVTSIKISTPVELKNIKIYPNSFSTFVQHNLEYKNHEKVIKPVNICEFYGYFYVLGVGGY